MKKFFFLAVACCLVMNLWGSPIVSKPIAFISEWHQPDTVLIFNDGAGSMYDTQSPICEKEDTLKYEVIVSPNSKIESDFLKCYWQIRKDDETAWTNRTKNAIKIYKKDFNQAVDDGSYVRVQKDGQFKFDSDDEVAQKMWYIRLAIAISEGDTVYSGELEIEPRYRVRITGNKVWSYVIDDYYHTKDYGETFEVRAKDTIYFKGKNMIASCEVNRSQTIISSSEGIACATDWWVSCSLEPTVNTYSMTFYAEGNLHKTFSKVSCGLSAKECGYTLNDPILPSGAMFAGNWKDRASNKTYTTQEVMDLYVGEDMVFDAQSTATDLHELAAEQGKVTKVVCNGHLLILYNGKILNALGVEVQ